MKKSGVLIGAVVALAAMVLGAWAFQNTRPEQRADPPGAIPSALVRFHSPSLGPTDAKVTLVEFLDPSCEACRAFYPMVKTIIGENQGKVRLVVRYAPFHKGSDYVIKILEAAKLQGLFWPTLDEVFTSQPVWASHANPQLQKVWESLPRAGLNIERAKKDMESPTIAAILKQDSADLVALKVERTPTFYVNGKLLQVTSEGGLRALIAQEVKASYP